MRKQVAVNIEAHLPGVPVQDLSRQVDLPREIIEYAIATVESQTLPPSHITADKIIDALAKRKSKESVMKLNREQIIRVCQHSYPNIPFSKSDNGGWNAGYITVLDDGSFEDGSSSVYQSDDSHKIKPQFMNVISSNGRKLHKYDDELFFLSLETEDNPRFDCNQTADNDLADRQ